MAMMGAMIDKQNRRAGLAPKREFCFECDCELVGPLCPDCNHIGEWRPGMISWQWLPPFMLLALGAGVLIGATFY